MSDRVQKPKPTALLAKNKGKLESLPLLILKVRIPLLNLPQVARFPGSGDQDVSMHHAYRTQPESFSESGSGRMKQTIVVDT